MWISAKFFVHAYEIFTDSKLKVKLGKTAQQLAKLHGTIKDSRIRG